MAKKIPTTKIDETLSQEELEEIMESPEVKKKIASKAPKSKGWFLESARHALARKGIKTGTKTKALKKAYTTSKEKAGEIAHEIEEKIPEPVKETGKIFKETGKEIGKEVIEGQKEIWGETGKEFIETEKEVARELLGKKSSPDTDYTEKLTGIDPEMFDKSILSPEAMGIHETNTKTADEIYIPVGITFDANFVNKKILEIKQLPEMERFDAYMDLTEALEHQRDKIQNKIEHYYEIDEEYEGEYQGKIRQLQDQYINLGFLAEDVEDKQVDDQGDTAPSVEDTIDIQPEETHILPLPEKTPEKKIKIEKDEEEDDDTINIYMD